MRQYFFTLRHGRVDAFGAIFNEVSANFLDIPENVKPADAPVSYPCLWDAPQHDRVQWNGAAENRTSELGVPLFGTDQVGALGRNAGEVLGVFGHVDIHQFELLLPRPYESTVRKENLIAIEASLAKLWSPEWPFAPIDDEPEIRRRGELLYQQHCVECHAIIDRDDPNRRIKAHLANVGTDLTMVKNFFRTAKTGVLKGRIKTVSGIANLEIERLRADEPVGVILKHIVERTILNSLSLAELKAAIKAAKVADLDSLNPGYQNTAIITMKGKEYPLSLDKLIEVADKIEVDSSEAKLLSFARRLRGGDDEASTLSSLESIPRSLFNATGSTEDDPANAVVPATSALLAYKARPLNGVWATAPYLHNGSVLNLRELLKPQADRKKVFHVGSTEFDTENVGFVDDPNFPSFDTSVKGNHNTGHEYGTGLTETEKSDLIEYLKSL